MLCYPERTVHPNPYLGWWQQEQLVITIVLPDRCFNRFLAGDVRLMGCTIFVQLSVFNGIGGWMTIDRDMLHILKVHIIVPPFGDVWVCVRHFLQELSV